VALALAALAIAAGAVGCGEEEGVAEGATVTAYVEAPLCERAGRQVSAGDSVDGGSFRVRLVCLPDPRGPQLSQGVGGRRLDLAVVGANARRATQDSTAIAYLQVDDPEANRFAEPILEAAGIGWITAEARGPALRQLSEAVLEAESGSLRADVREALGQG
jgi:hypothetical protein